MQLNALTTYRLDPVTVGCDGGRGRGQESYKAFCYSIRSTEKKNRIWI